MDYRNISNNMIRLDGLFGLAHREIRFVGGCVRDSLLGLPAKDIDLCTDATPDEQIAIYKAEGITYYETGLKHGTLTVSFGDGETYEITSLRTETEHDGRHAKVAYTRDWKADLARRDLTINAMSMTFNGDLFDPFGGRHDLEAGRVRFVGDASERMREDYLRILRWLRFHARFAKGKPIDEDAEMAAVILGKGLEGISRERVWSEVSRIVTGPDGALMLREMMRLGLAYPCGLPNGSWREVARLEQPQAITAMVAFLGDLNRVRNLGERWKWSSDEMKLAEFLGENLPQYNADYHRMLAHDGVSREWVYELAKLHDRADHIPALMTWTVPEFPVRGKDLIERGMKPGPEVGTMLSNLKLLWADGIYRPTKDELLARVITRPELEQKLDAMIGGKA